MNEIVWKNKALRQLRKIKSKETRKTIKNAVAPLKEFPNCRNITKIKTTHNYRLTVGKWRVIFTPELKIISIEEVRKRNERTYKR